MTRRDHIRHALDVIYDQIFNKARLTCCRASCPGHTSSTLRMCPCFRYHDAVMESSTAPALAEQKVIIPAQILAHRRDGPNCNDRFVLASATLIDSVFWFLLL
jgi:hypothetical protein